MSNDQSIIWIYRMKPCALFVNALGKCVICLLAMGLATVLAGCSKAAPEPQACNTDEMYCIPATSVVCVKTTTYGKFDPSYMHGGDEYHVETQQIPCP
jgi:hypothetical protein